MPKRFIDNYLLFQLAILSHTFSAEFYKFLKQQNMSPARWRILLNLSKTPGMFITQLAEHTCYEQSRVTRIVDSLCEEGLVKRVLGENDRRRVRVKITQKGEKTLVPLVKAAEVHESRVLSEIPNSDRIRLKKILATFVKNHVDNIEDPEDEHVRRKLRRAS